MLLDELITSLALGELGSSKLFTEKPRNPDALYEMTPRNRASLINHINDATMTICRKLPLYWFSTIIRLVEGKNTYELNSKHSILNMPESLEIPDEPLILGSEEAYYYIYDALDYPFRDNVLLLGKITSESGLYDLPIGSNAYDNAVYSPRPNILEIPEDMFDNDEYLTIHYQGYLPYIPLNTLEGSDVTVDLPLPLVEAVSAFICHKLQLRPQDPNNASISLSHMERFNTICAEYWKDNINNISGDVGMHIFERQGWK